MRLTPDQKVVGSNPVWVTDIFFLFLRTWIDASRRQLALRKVWGHSADMRGIYDAQDVIRCLAGKTFLVFKQFQIVIAVRFGDRIYR